MYVLERMIEEELLIKRAIDLGMLENNPMARGTIVQQMIKTIISENDRYEIPDQDLINFLRRILDFLLSLRGLDFSKFIFQMKNFQIPQKKGSRSLRNAY